MRIRMAVIVVAVVVVFFGGWALMYPSPDPQSIKYVLWKADLYKLNVEEATGTMVGDPNRDKLVARQNEGAATREIRAASLACGGLTIPQRVLPGFVLEGQGCALHRAEFMDGRI